MGDYGETIELSVHSIRFVPKEIFWLSLSIATSAAIIASQALISRSFTLISEAIYLCFWPRHRVLFPGNIKGQVTFR